TSCGWSPASLPIQSSCSNRVATRSRRWPHREKLRRSYRTANGCRAQRTEELKAQPKDSDNMNRVLSTHVCVNHRLTVAWLNKALQAGIPAVEIFCARQHLDYRDRGQITELGHWFRDAELKLHSIHSPMYSDEIWGRTGPQAVITITEPVKSKRMPMV